MSRSDSPADAKDGAPNEFEQVKLRLEEIARTVDDESLSLDDALDLYEEAVKLGLRASSLLEADIVVPDETEGGSEGPNADTAGADGAAVGGETA